MTGQTQVTVKILDRDYHVACPPEEREALLKAADLLGREMSEVRDSAAWWATKVGTALRRASNLRRSSRRDLCSSEEEGGILRLRRCRWSPLNRRFKGE